MADSLTRSIIINIIICFRTSHHMCCCCYVFSDSAGELSDRSFLRQNKTDGFAIVKRNFFRVGVYFIVNPCHFCSLIADIIDISLNLTSLYQKLINDEVHHEAADNFVVC